MSWSRREFVATAAVAATLPLIPDLPSPAAEPLPLVYDEPTYLVGDPYRACADGPGLGGRSFEQACSRALRFRTPPEERDRLAREGDPFGA